jgi:hypothetical protein
VATVGANLLTSGTTATASVGGDVRFAPYERRPRACGLQRPQPSPATTVMNVRRIHCVSAGLGAFCPTSEREDSRRGRLEALLTRTAWAHYMPLRLPPVDPSHAASGGKSEERRGV